jgi:flagellar capping protein FliD
LVFDSAKFSAAFKNNSSDVTALLDAGLSGLNTQVSNYAGSNGTLSRALTSIDDQRTSYDKRIAKYNEALTARKEALFNQYYGYQNQLVEYGYQQQMFNAMYGTGTNVNSSG